jgi:hypothetical protein
MENRELQMVQKFLGLVGKMRKHQIAYFKQRMEYDKKEAMKYEKEVDDYIRVLMKAGLQPVFDNQGQTNLF